MGEQSGSHIATPSKWETGSLELRPWKRDQNVFLYTSIEVLSVQDICSYEVHQAMQ